MSAPFWFDRNREGALLEAWSVWRANDRLSCGCMGPVLLRRPAVSLRPMLAKTLTRFAQHGALKGSNPQRAR